MKVGTMNTKEFNTYEDKEQFVQGVFSNIAKHYDYIFINYAWMMNCIEYLRDINDEFKE